MKNLLEVWQDIPFFENKYQISNHGRLRRLYKSKDPRILTKRVKAGIKVSEGTKKPYVEYALCYGDKKYKYYLAHRLVAEAFIPNPEKLPVVHHIDNNPQNNRIDNLQWSTYRDNTLEGIKNGTFTQTFNSENNPNKKFDNKIINSVRALYKEGWMQKDIAEIFGISRGHVCDIVNNKKR